MNPYYVTIQDGGNYYAPFLVGYLKDGGFFVKDLSLEDDVYGLPVLLVNGKSGLQESPLDRERTWRLLIKPKLVHHMDGNAHISGTGIRSGFYRMTGRAKGLHIKSFNLLTERNDGGPVFTVGAWGLSHFKQAPVKGRVLFRNADRFNHRHFFQGPRHTHYFEAFYFPRVDQRFVDLATGTMRMPHPIFGTIRLRYLPPPDYSAGFLAMSYTDGRCAWDSDYGVSMNGAPGWRRPDGAWETINIVHPAPAGLVRGARNLAFRRIDRLVCALDDVFGGLRRPW